MITPPVSFTIAVEIAATVTSALSGMITAAQKKLDIVGTASLALVTAFAGGTIRDLLIDRRPFFWDSRWEYVPVIIGMTLAFVYSARFHRVARLLYGKAVFIDALGLGMFSLTGLSYALATDLSPFTAVLIGVLTGTGGGVVRDTLVHETPLDLPPRRPPLRARGLRRLLGHARRSAWAGLSHFAAGATGFVTIVALRMLSVRYGVSVPDPLWLRESKSAERPAA